jgi:quinol monooxygenase YgiN
MTYGRHGSLKTHPGKRDEVVAILLKDVDGLKAVGCQLYVVSEDRDDPDLIWVHEVWDDAASHKASIQLPATRAAIAAAMPMLTGEFTGVETDVVGGLAG